jgi:hypothetical protein
VRQGNRTGGIAPKCRNRLKVQVWYDLCVAPYLI